MTTHADQERRARAAKPRAAGHHPAPGTPPALHYHPAHRDAAGVISSAPAGRAYTTQAQAEAAARPDTPAGRYPAALACAYQCCRPCDCPDWLDRYHQGERYCPAFGRPSAVCAGCGGCRFCQLMRDELLPPDGVELGPDALWNAATCADRTADGLPCDICAVV